VVVVFFAVICAHPSGLTAPALCRACEKKARKPVTSVLLDS
jgi:hypothetical protein